MNKQNENSSTYGLEVVKANTELASLGRKIAKSIINKKLPQDLISENVSLKKIKYGGITHAVIQFFGVAVFRTTSGIGTLDIIGKEFTFGDPMPNGMKPIHLKLFRPVQEKAKEEQPSGAF